LVTLTAVVLTNVCSGSRVCCGSNQRFSGCVAVELSLLPLKSTICYLSICQIGICISSVEQRVRKEYQNMNLCFISSEFRTTERSGSMVDAPSDLGRSASGCMHGDRPYRPMFFHGLNFFPRYWFSVLKSTVTVTFCNIIPRTILSFCSKSKEFS